ncbi:MAG: hypothetical protein KIT73_10005 [Burkholderiales bacterium]|nr:hypothetical protein [Burkholderiales bacterium]
MHSSPITKWEGAEAFFTFADKPGVVMFLFLLAVAVSVFAIVSIIKHENQSYRKLK